jgi:hypothetical protein
MKRNPTAAWLRSEKQRLIEKDKSRFFFVRFGKLQQPLELKILRI